jgi:guanyl-specific ribonuclease Sa
LKKPLLIGLGLAVVLVALAVALPSWRAQLMAPPDTVPAPPSSRVDPGAATTLGPGSPGTTGSTATGPTAGSLGPATPGASSGTPRPPEAPSLKSVGGRSLDAQIRRVVDSMERTGRPPTGVVQGGRRGGKRGVFENAERKLPAKPSGYYRESDVWPPRRAGARGPDRLVIGREGEVYYSADHYRSFVRLR